MAVGQDLERMFPPFKELAEKIVYNKMLQQSAAEGGECIRCSGMTGKDGDVEQFALRMTRGLLQDCSCL
eukprot:767341-Hanusia_phi.AAC.2